MKEFQSYEIPDSKRNSPGKCIKTQLQKSQACEQTNLIGNCPLSTNWNESGQFQIKKLTHRVVAQERYKVVFKIALMTNTYLDVIIAEVEYF